MRAGPGRRDSGLDECERTAQSLGEESVRLGSVTHHHHRRRLGADQVGDEFGHRSFGLSGDYGIDPADRGNRSNDGSTTGIESVRRRIRRVAVGSDQSSAGVDGVPGNTQSGVVEVAVQPDHHCVERSVHVGAAIRHCDRTALLDRLDDARATSDQHAFAGFHQEGSGHRRRHDVAHRIHADPGQRLFVGADDRGGIVGDEQHSAAGRPTPGDRIDGTCDRFVREPHDTVEVTQDGVDRRLRVRGAGCSWHPVSVPRFTPFPALRYSNSNIDALIAPPYDVLSDAELDELNQRDPSNITHVDVPREADGPGRYERAGETLRQWIETGVMTFDDVATYTLYRMRFTDAAGAQRDIVGVLGGLEVGPYGECGVLPHERITPKASTDRLDLTRATRANMSPVWGLSLAGGLTELLTDPGEPIAAVTIDGVTHTVERVSDPERIAAIGAKIATDDVLIADGHHRYGVAQTFRDEMRAAAGDHTPAEDTLVFVSELVADQLSVEAIHRLYSNVSFDDLAAALDAAFDRTPAGTAGAGLLAELNERGALCLVGPTGDAEWLSPKPGVFDGVRSLDGLWLETVLSDLEHAVSYQHGVDRVVEAVSSGAATAGVLIRPVSVDEIERTAREGVVMPPKSTFFTPKLLTGLVIRPLA